MHYLNDLFHINKFDHSIRYRKRIVKEFLKLFMEISLIELSISTIKLVFLSSIL